jgi:hypothetical protein
MVITAIVIAIIITIIIILKNKNKLSIKETYVGSLRVATPLDEKRALKYALREICQKGGYEWFDSDKDEFLYDCKHSKATCVNESIFPTPAGKNANYQEWRTIDSPDGKTIAKRSARMMQSPTGYCIMGNEEFRKLCEKELLDYNPSTGECKTTRDYCKSKFLAFCPAIGEEGYDCYENFVTAVTGKVFGNTLSRTITKPISDVADLSC